MFAHSLTSLRVTFRSWVQQWHTFFKRAEVWSLVCLPWADSLPPQITAHNTNRKLAWTNLIWNKLATASSCDSQRSYELVMISIWHFYWVLNVALSCCKVHHTVQGKWAVCIGFYAYWFGGLLVFFSWIATEIWFSLCIWDISRKGMN